ncbi:MAG: hypothetical protein D6736_13695 [Nitrospinota bacterium]|nr:MAG: hypothetical protein D6736_13695 [Nitrospinota bacterium]
MQRVAKALFLLQQFRGHPSCTVDNLAAALSIKLLPTCMHYGAVMAQSIASPETLFWQAAESGELRSVLERVLAVETTLQQKVFSIVWRAGWRYF